MFAQPFLGDFAPGHVDGVYSLAKDPESLEHLASGSGDGIVKVWDQTNREEKWQVREYQVQGVCAMCRKKGSFLACLQRAHTQGTEAHLINSR